MKKSYYLFNPGRMSRKDNTLQFIATDENGNEQPAKYLPIEGIDNLYIFGSIDANSALYNLLGKENISVHFFDYYEHYTGSFMPKDYLLAGRMQIAQTKAYLDKSKRLNIAKKLVEGAAWNILKNLKYYQGRGKNVSSQLVQIEALSASIVHAVDIPSLMGLEGNIHKYYYDAFDLIIDDFAMDGRVKRPPSNEINALVSFGNSLCYTECLDQVYHTQLNPTISFLHEPGYRRYSLCLDLAEIFKPILADRTIFTVLNKRQLKSDDFIIGSNGCILKDSGKKTFIAAFEERLKETIQHRTLKKNVSYKHLIRLECYKLSKYILGIEAEYKPFKAWW